MNDNIYNHGAVGPYQDKDDRQSNNTEHGAGASNLDDQENTGDADIVRDTDNYGQEDIDRIGAIQGLPAIKGSMVRSVQSNK